MDRSGVFGWLQAWIVLMTVASMTVSSPLAAQEGVGPRLEKLYSRSLVAEKLIPRENWRPFADISDRAFWDGLPAETRAAHLERGEKALGAPWPMLPASLYLEFERIGNRSNYEGVYFARRERLLDLVLAECIENCGRFSDEIVNGLWAVLEESSWCIPAHIGSQSAGGGLPDMTEPYVDLFAAETVSLLAWIDYLVPEKLDGVSTLIRPRIERQVKERVLDPCLERSDFWWMGWGVRARVNNWNPWVSSNWITAALLLERDPERRIEAVWKAMRALDNFIGTYHGDGGCDEGPSYWGRAGASLFDCLELLHSATGGAVDIYGDPLIRNMGRFIYRAHIHGSYYINFADASARVSISDDLTYRYGKRISDPLMMALGAWAARENMARSKAVPGYVGRVLPALANLRELLSAEAFQPLVRDVWLDGIQVMAARSKEGSPEGFYLAAKGGHNAESHNHNDVGNFIVYYEGRPALIDAGVGTYTAQTFSNRRYEIWTMQSAWHNLPTINGVMQQPGREFEAREVKYVAGGSRAEFSLDIAGAYPPEAGVKSWKRNIRLERGREVRISDSFSLGKREGELSLSLLTPCKVDISRPGELILDEQRAPEGATPFRLRVLFDRNRLSASVEEKKIDDARLMGSWGGNLHRVVLSAPEGSPLADTWNIRITK